jgi:hypothetical protein
MSLLIRKKIDDVVITCEEDGTLIANANDEQQRVFLRAMANAVDKMGRDGGSWPMQCRAIVDGCRKGGGLSQSERIRIRSMLDCLMDHLSEPAAEI